MPLHTLRIPCGRLKYEYVALIGVDLTTAEHFYSTLPAYGNVRDGVAAFESMATKFAVRMYNTSMHATAGRGVHYFLEQLAIERREQGQWLLNLAPDSLLASCKELRTISLRQTDQCYASKKSEFCVASVFKRLGTRTIRNKRLERFRARKKMMQSTPTPVMEALLAARQCHFLVAGGTQERQATPLLLHRIAPRKTRMWKRYMSSWSSLGARVIEYHDEDLDRLVNAAFPELAKSTARMRTLIERTDIARLAVMHLYGGIYADLDMELLEPNLMHELVCTADVVVPFEKDRLVGQSILFSSTPKHPLWRILATRMVHGYNPDCYETLNTGPDRLTLLWNEMCEGRHNALRNATLHRGLVRGPVTWHHTTGKRSWKRSSNNESALRKAGAFGCIFVRSNVTCGWPRRETRAVRTLHEGSQHRMSVLRTPEDTLRIAALIPIHKPRLGSILFHDARRYDNAISMNGVRRGGNEYFVSRLCDAGCTNGRHITASTILFGRLHCNESNCWWSPRSHEVHVGFAYSQSRHFFNGPEDARLDSYGGGVFAIANIPTTRGCSGSSWTQQKMRDMAFIPLSSSLPQACRIRVKRTERCRREKNWASLVAKGNIHFVYSLIPFQVVRFDPVNCIAIPQGAVGLQGLQRANMTLRGSTRYVYGTSVPNGEIFWGIVHAQKRCHSVRQRSARKTVCQYVHSLAAILVTSGGSFEFLGTSGPICEDIIWSSLLPSRQFTPNNSFVYIHSIISYDHGEAEIGFHVDDNRNFRAKLFGVPKHLAQLYARHKKPSSAPPRASDAEPAVVRDLQGSSRSRKHATLRAKENTTMRQRVALVSDFILADPSGRRSAWLEKAKQSVQCYASRHGYAFYSRLRADYTAEEKAFPEPSLLQKTRLVDRHLDEHEWVVWIDYDVLIINASVLLEPLLDRATGFDVIVADGGDEVNAGIFAVRNSVGGRRFLRGYEQDAVKARMHGGHLPWRDNGYLMHAVLRGIVEDTGTTYADECLKAGLRRSKPAFKRCFWRLRQRLNGLDDASIGGPPRNSRAVHANMSSGASYRVYMSRDGILNNLLSWKAPNNYRPGDLLIHFAGPDKNVVSEYLDQAYVC